MVWDDNLEAEGDEEDDPGDGQDGAENVHCARTVPLVEVDKEKLLSTYSTRRFFGRVGVKNAIDFALGTFQIMFTLIKIYMCL